MRAFLIAVALMLLTAGAVFAADAGSVVGVNGACSVARGGNRTPLTLGAGLQVGDVVEIPAEGRLKLRMADGSIVALGSATQFTITTYAVTAGGQRQDAKLSLAQGLLHAIVTPVEPAAKFEVQTAVGTAAVRSTDWLVEATATTQQVTVVSGSVSVTSGATGHGIVVPAGQQTRLDAGHDPLPPRPLLRAELERLVGRAEVGAPRGQKQPAHPPPEGHPPPHAERPPGGPPPAHIEPPPPHLEQLPAHVETHPEPHRHRIEPPPPHREPHHPYRHPPRERWREPHRERGAPYHRPEHERRYPDRGERR